MAEDLLERILREVRERKEAARSAYEESVRLQAALDALGSARGPSTSTPAAPAPSPAPPRRTARGENRRRILEVIQDRPGASAGEVAQVTGIARPTAASTLSKLAADGEVERVERPAGGVGFRIASPGAEEAGDDQVPAGQAGPSAAADGADEEAGTDGEPPDA